MVRLRPYFVEDQPLYIIQRGNNREAIFAAEEDYRFYLECLEDAAERQALAIHAYVLMTNHVHLLASLGKEASLPKTLQSVGRRYVQYFNYTYGRTGTLWPLSRIPAPAALVHLGNRSCIALPPYVLYVACTSGRPVPSDADRHGALSPDLHALH